MNVLQLIQKLQTRPLDQRANKALLAVCGFTPSIKQIESILSNKQNYIIPDKNPHDNSNFCFETGLAGFCNSRDCKYYSDNEMCNSRGV